MGAKSYYNNTFVNSRLGMESYCAFYPHIDLVNNLFAGYTTAVTSFGSASCLFSTATGNAFYPSVNSAHFVNTGASDPSLRNLHLQGDSPAADTGINLAGIVDTDFEGTDRTQGAYDMGAYAATASPR